MEWGGARVYVVAHEILVSALGPLVLGLGLKGLGLRVWGQGLTIVIYHTLTLIHPRVPVFVLPSKQRCERDNYGHDPDE